MICSFIYNAHSVFLQIANGCQTAITLRKKNMFNIQPYLSHHPLQKKFYGQWVSQFLRTYYEHKNDAISLFLTTVIVKKKILNQYILSKGQNCPTQGS